VSPPELTGDAPILHVLHPSVPVGLVLLRSDGHFSGSSSLQTGKGPKYCRQFLSCSSFVVRKAEEQLESKAYLDGLVGKRLAVDPPLRLEDGLDDIARLAVDQKKGG
jgi:hypothetical protein